jgi:predicted nucleic acid-binding protein
MIYLDTSVALAHLLGETRRPPTALWQQALVSSRLLEYELWAQFLRARDRTLSLATYDARMQRAAHALELPLFA